MPAIPSALIQRLRDTLARCPALESDRALRAIFVDTRLAAWLNRVPENTANRANRVNALIAALCAQSTVQAENTLILFLHTLADQIDLADALHDDLLSLAAELAAYPPADLAALKPAVQSPVRLPPFAIITGVIAILLIAIIALANFPTARDQLTTLFQSRAFHRERKGETLIVIATFHRSEGVTDTEPHEKIRRAIEQAQAEVGFTTLRVAVEPTHLRADDRARAQALGDRYNASLVIWGEDTGIEVRVNFYNRKQPTFEAADVRIEETVRTQIAAPSAYAEFITQDLPAQLTFLSLFAVGQSYYSENAYAQSAALIEQAVAAFERQVAAAAGNAEIIHGAVSAYYALGWLYQVPLREPAKIVPAYTRAIELNPNLASTYVNRGIHYHTLGQYAEAEADYTRAFELDPDFAIAYNNRGFTYADLGEYTLALADFTRAIELNPAYVTAYSNRGAIYVALGQYALALADFNRAIELNPDSAPAYHNRGRTYRALGEYDLALADYTRALALNPDYTAAYTNRGSTYYDMGQYAQAEADYTRAIALDPDAAKAYHNRGSVYRDLGDYDSALADYTRAIVLDQEFATAYQNRGITYYHMHNYDNALTDYTRAIALDPKSTAAYSNRGSVYHDLGDYDSALADYTRAIVLDPEFAIAYQNRGITYYHMDNYDNALADFTRAIALHPESANAYYYGAITHTARGDIADACAWLENALTLVPDWRDYARTNPAFDPLRSEPCFLALINGK